MQPESYLAEHLGPTCERALEKAQLSASARCGPFRIALRFKSRRLAEAIGPVFVKTDDAPHDLTIAFLARREFDISHLIPVPADAHHSVVTRGKDFAAWWPGERPLLYLLDRKRRCGLVWFAGVPPNWELSRPGLPLIQAWSSDTTWSPAHGGAVGWNGGFVLLAGAGRSGKTTATLACARAGWDYVGDDYILADTLGGRVEPLYTSARLRHDMSSSFDDFVRASTGTTDDEGDKRHELRLSGLLPDHQFRGGSIKVILLPRRQGSTIPTFAPARRFDAYTALIKCSILSLPGWSATLSIKLADLICRAPAFFVDTGSDPAAVPDAFRAFLDAL